MKNKRPTQPGMYLYKMPTWDNPVKVNVLFAEDTKTLLVSFTRGYKPGLMDDVHVSALWEPIEEMAKSKTT